MIENIKPIMDEITKAKGALHNADSYALINLKNEKYSSFSKGYSLAVELLNDLQKICMEEKKVD